MRKTTAVLWLVTMPALATCAEYFVDSDGGSDEASGSGPEHAIRSLDRLAGITLEPGDTVRLKAGSAFRGRLRFSGNGTKERPLHLTSYGEGPKPEILGSVIPTGWQQHAGEVHRVSIPAESFRGPGATYGVCEYDGPVPRRLRRAEGIPSARGSFFFDKVDSTLYVITTDGLAPERHRIEVSLIDEILSLTGRSWIEIEGLAFLFGNCRHINIVDCHDVTIRNCASLFMGLYGNPNTLIHRGSTRVALLDCFLYDNANCGVFLSSGATRCRVAGCTIVKCSSNDGITCHSGGRDDKGVRQGLTGDYNVIDSNVIGLCPEESIDITSGDYHTILGNICYGNGNPGIIVGHDSDHIRIESNICFGNRRSGIHIAGSEAEGARGHNRVIRNLVYDNDYPGIEIDAPGTVVWHNTVVDSRKRVGVRINPAGSGSDLRNNIICTLDPTIPHPSVHFIRGTPAGFGVTFGYNLLYHAGDAAKPEVFLPTSRPIRTDDGSFGPEGLIATYGTGEGCLLAKPLFADIENRYYLLSADSPAVDAGADLGLPFEGNAPDLGWRELSGKDVGPRYPAFLIDGENDDPKILSLWGKPSE